MVLIDRKMNSLSFQQKLGLYRGYTWNQVLSPDFSLNVLSPKPQTFFEEKRPVEKVIRKADGTVVREIEQLTRKQLMSKLRNLGLPSDQITIKLKQFGFKRD